MQENIKYNISSENSSKINQWLSKFPDDQKKPAIIYALHLIQKELTFLVLILRFAYIILIQYPYLIL